MMEQQHTPEPWCIDKYRNFMTPEGNLLLGGVSTPCVLGDNMRKGWANARRIVACVNACAGFSNDELEGANLHKDSIDAQNEIDELRADLATAEQDSRQKQAMIDRLERERDELLAALDEALPMVPCGSISDVKLAALAANGHLTAEMILRHRAIIASMKGGSV